MLPALWRIACMLLLFRNVLRVQALFPLTSTVDPSTCLLYLCSDHSKCIPHHFYCDGEKDCTDGSDEQPGCVPVPCSSEEFTCVSNHKCIPKIWHCDGSNDCDDSSDEEECHGSTHSCTMENGYFSCNTTSQCFALHFLCNGEPNCKDHSDEGGLCHVACHATMCSHKCQVTPRGPVCVCPTGMRLDADKRTCSDIDECATWPPVCSHRCSNSAGNYQCHCHSGYLLDVDGHSCKASGAPARMFFSVHSQVKVVALDTNVVSVLHATLPHPVDVGYDADGQRVYWSDTEHHSIVSSNMDGYNITHVIRFGLIMPESVAIDWVAHRLYIVDSDLHSIVACTLNGSMCATIVDTRLDKPRSIALDAVSGVMYWSDWGEVAKIEKSGMDGSHREAIVTTNIVWPNGITLDKPMQVIYWADASLDRLECVGIDGSNRRVVLSEFVHHPFSVAVFEDTIYWSDWQLKSIMSANKFTGKNLKALVEKQNRPMGIHIYQYQMQTRGHNYCYDNQCSHMCVLNGHASYSCKCPNGMVLLADQYTCADDTSSSYLLVAGKQVIIKIYPSPIGRSPEVILPLEDLKNVVAVDYDWQSRNIFYSDESSDVIVQVDFDANHRKEIVSGGLNTVEGIAVDWIAKNLYWSDSHRSVIEVSRLNGSSRLILISDGLYNPRGLAIDPLHSSLYIADWGKSACIKHCDLAGIHCVILVAGLGWPNDVSLDLNIDHSKSRIYWTDAQLGTIESALLDGQDRKVVTKMVYHPYSLAIMDNVLIWSDWKTSALHFADKLTGSDSKQLEIGKDDLMGMVVVSGKKQLTGHNGCTYENGGCSHLCLATKIHMSYVCRCPMGLGLAEDQHSCVGSKACSEDEFSCRHGCIPLEYLCDGYEHCSEGEDELAANCKVDCTQQQFKCADGQCINVQWKCDGQNDCGDNSDEANCTKSQCSSFEFECSTGECIYIDWRCDGEADCADGSDEMDCRQRTCRPNEFRCDLGKCIPHTWYCDGDADCANSEDELAGCEHAILKCNDGEWQCTNMRCIDVSWKCNGNDDCGDMSDESGCEIQSHCTEDSFVCHVTQQCIDASWYCDGESDCPDGEDEVCASSVTCEPSMFKCRKSEQCIPDRWRCDEENDCEDGSDEEQCSHSTTSEVTTQSRVTENVGICHEGAYACDSHECISLEEVCNGHDDCVDSSDEGLMCKFACGYNNGGCSNMCKATPVGALCQCAEGFTLMHDGKTCEDKNECLSSPCSQGCINIKGSYKCVCTDGYQLQADHKYCKATGPVAQLLFAVDAELRSLSVDGAHYDVIINTKNQQIIAIDYLYKTRDIYWSDFTSLSIKHYNLDSRKMHTLLAGVSTDGLAVDWIAHNIYYPDTLTRSIWVCAISGYISCKSIVNTDIDKPRAIVVHPARGLLFWTDWGKHPMIKRAWMNGDHSMILVRHQLGWPNGLTIDFVHDKLYWADAHLNKLEVVDLDGNNRHLVTSSKVHHPFSMSLFEDYLYWSEWTLRSVMRVDKWGTNYTVLQQGLHKPMDVKIYHPVRQPAATNHCKSKGCSHLCLLTPAGATCACPLKYQLSPVDSKQCIGVSREEVYKTRGRSQVDDCDQCQQGSSCVSVNGSYLCNCAAGFMGVYCNETKEEPKIKQLLTRPSYMWVAGVVVTVICLIAFSAIFLYCYRRRLNANQKTGIIRFCKGKKGSVSSSDLHSLVNAYENPGFQSSSDIEKEDVNANMPAFKTNMHLLSCSDESLESDLNSRGMVVEMGSRTPLTSTKC